MKKIYFFICFLYSELFSFLETFLLFDPQKILKKSNILLEGYEILNFEHTLSIQTTEKEIKLNDYMTKYILNQDDIYESLSIFFKSNEFRNVITAKTGYEYSVDYIIYYTTYKIPESEKIRDIYANKWHNDKPFTKNTLKIIIPLNESDTYNGGIEILNLKQSKLYKKGQLKKEEEHFVMKSKLGQILLFLPNKCLHKAGIPKINEGRTQIMMQLNPSKKWCFNKKLYEKQFKIEPKFPYLNYIFNGKINL